MTRRSVLEIVRAAKRHGWRVILGGPESANYTASISSRRRRDRDRRRRADAGRAAAGARARRARIGLHDVAGIAFRDETGAVVHTRERAKLTDLDSLPLPDREAIDHQLYLDAWKTHHGASSINLITARGCPYRCNWCSHAVYGYTHRRRSPATVADEVQAIVDRYDPDQVWYADDVFTISHPWLDEYAAELERRGIHRPFETITRADRLQSEAAVATAAQARLLSDLDRLGERQPEDPRRDGARRDRRAGAPLDEARAGARHSGRHVLDVGLRGRGARGHRRDGRAREAQQPGRVLHDGLLSDQGHGLFRRRCATRSSCRSPGRDGIRSRLRRRRAAAARTTTSSRISGCAARSRRLASRRRTPRAPPSSWARRGRRKAAMQSWGAA